VSDVPGTAADMFYVSVITPVLAHFLTHWFFFHHWPLICKQQQIDTGCWKSYVWWSWEQSYYFIVCSDSVTTLNTTGSVLGLHQCSVVMFAVCACNINAVDGGGGM
jgi:hypothetical protein